MHYPVRTVSVSVFCTCPSASLSKVWNWKTAHTTWSSQNRKRLPESTDFTLRRMDSWHNITTIYTNTNCSWAFQIIYGALSCKCRVFCMLIHLPMTLRTEQDWCTTPLGVSVRWNHSMAHNPHPEWALTPLSLSATGGRTQSFGRK